MNDRHERGWLLPAIICAVILPSSLCLFPAQLRAGPTATSGVTLLRNNAYAEALVKGIRNSRSGIVCSFYLFKTGSGRSNLPRRIAEELIRARQRGVAVSVILERSGRQLDALNDDNRHTASLLIRGGVEVRFDSPDITSHSKVVVIDNRLVFLGSHNLTEAALRHNNELSVLIDSPAMASEVISALDAE